MPKGDKINKTRIRLSISYQSRPFATLFHDISQIRIVKYGHARTNRFLISAKHLSKEALLKLRRHVYMNLLELRFFQLLCTQAVRKIAVFSESSSYSIR